MDDLNSLPPGRDKFAAFLSTAGAHNGERDVDPQVQRHYRVNASDEYYEEDDDEDIDDEAGHNLHGRGKRLSHQWTLGRPATDRHLVEQEIDALDGEESDVIEEADLGGEDDERVGGPAQRTSVTQRLTQRLSKGRSGRASDGGPSADTSSGGSVLKRISRRLSSRKALRKSAEHELDEQALPSEPLDDLDEEESASEDAVVAEDQAQEAVLPRPGGRVRRLSAQWEAGVFAGSSAASKPEPVLQRVAKRLSRSHRKSATRAQEEALDNELAMADADVDDEAAFDEMRDVHSEDDRLDDDYRDMAEEDDDFVGDDEFQDEDELREDKDGEEEGEVQPAAENRRPSAVQSLISLFVTGAVNTKKEPEKRSSLTALRKNGTLSRRKTRSGKLSSRATPHDEFKLSLGPNRGDPESDPDANFGDDVHEPLDLEGENGEQGSDAGDDEAASDSGKSRRSSSASEASDADRRSRLAARLDRIRSMNISPTCPVCDKVVYRMEKLSDSRDRAFHYYCLKCEDCPKNLSGEVVHVLDGEETGRTGGRIVLCATHYHLRQNGQGELVKGWRPDTSGINYGGKYEGDPERARKAVSRSLGASLGRKPVCSRCGGEIMLSDKNFSVIGMERFHMKCPEQATIKHTPRHFVHAAPDRLPIVFSGFEDGKLGVSFLLRLESADAKEHALVQHRLAPASLRYVPDESALSSVSKTVRVSNEFFSISDRKHTFNEKAHPLSGKASYCEFDKENDLLLAQQYKIEGGVIHGLNAAFRYLYNEATGRATVEALVAELTFELLDQDGYTGAEAEFLQGTASKSAKKKDKAPLKTTNEPTAASLLLEDDFCERIKATL